MTEEKKPTKGLSKLKDLFNRPSKPYANPYLGGVLLGLVLFASYFITGNGLGASGRPGRGAERSEEVSRRANIAIRRNRTDRLLFQSIARPCGAGKLHGDLFRRSPG